MNQTKKGSSPYVSARSEGVLSARSIAGWRFSNLLAIANSTAVVNSLFSSSVGRGSPGGLSAPGLPSPGAAAAAADALDFSASAGTAPGGCSGIVVAVAAAALALTAAALASSRSFWRPFRTTALSSSACSNPSRNSRSLMGRVVFHAFHASGVEAGAPGVPGLPLSSSVSSSDSRVIFFVSNSRFFACRASFALVTSGSASIVGSSVASGTVTVAAAEPGAGGAGAEPGGGGGEAALGSGTPAVVVVVASLPRE